MMTKNRGKNEKQGELFKTFLKDLISQKHPLVRLAHSIDWQSFEDHLEPSFKEGVGRPSLPVRMMVAMHYLKIRSFDQIGRVSRNFRDNS